MRRLSALILFFTLVSSVHAENWPQWRGPFFNGSTTEKNLPTQFSQTENVAWKADLPGPSAATPVVWQDRVFVSSTDLEKKALRAMCLDRKTGKVLWQHVVAEGINQDTRSTFAAPSPATDGKVVVFFYGNGRMFVFDMEGKKKWENDFGPFAFLWTFSTSPVLYEGTLYLQVLQRDVAVEGRGKQEGNESYLLALDPQTGEEMWRHVRPSKARAESLEAFNTPMPFEYQGRKELIVAGGDDLTGHDLATGRELWRWGTWNPTRIGHWRLVPSPVAGGGAVLVCAPKGDPVYAIRAGGEGLLSSDDVLWTSRERREVSSDVPTPAFYDADFFVLSDVRKSLSRVEPMTGKVKWSVQTPGRTKYEASPLAADGKIYTINFDGEVAIFDAKDGKLINTIAMDERGQYNVRSSVVASGGKLFIRTKQALYCVGK